MIRHSTILALTFALLPAVAVGQESKPAGEKEKVSYALGVNLANQLRTQRIDVDPDALGKGLEDGLRGTGLRLSAHEVQSIVANLQRQAKEAQATRREDQMRGRRELADRNQRQGEAFLASNRAKPGVVTLPSGLQYRVLNAGHGRVPSSADTVVCHYRGTLLDGKEFDSSRARHAPATFSVNRVIKGWSEALQRMPLGSRWEIVIPPGLAYGTRGSGTLIGPNATLVFDVELLEVQGAASPGGSESARGPAERQAVRDSPAVDRGVRDLVVSFRVDPRLATSTYGSERWVSPATFNQTGEGQVCRVEARVQGLDVARNATAVSSPGWTADDTDMVAITPGSGSQVTMTVRRAGETTVHVASASLAKHLLVKATEHGLALHVTVSQQ